MKMKNFCLMAVACTALYLSACQKDFTNENITQSVPDGTSVMDSNYLDKIIYTTTVGNFTDTDFIQLYEYDAAKRVVALIDSIKTNNGIVESHTIKYFYNGNDSTPFKKVQVYKLFSAAYDNRDTTITFYSYLPGGIILTDSTVNFYHQNTTGSSNFDESSKKITRYQFASNKIYGTSTKTILFSSTNTSAGIPNNTYDTATLDIVGNLIRNERSDSQHVLYQTSTFTYDNKPNPFARLSNYKTLSVFPTGETFIDEMQAKNNRLHALEGMFPGFGYDNDLTGKYQYGTNGYPKQIVETDALGIHKTIFIYRSL